MERGFASEAPGTRRGIPGSAREVGGSPFIIRDLPVVSAIARFARSTLHNGRNTWGSATLHPRLYAVAALRGLRQTMST